MVQANWDAVIYREHEKWIGHLLQHDLCVQASSINEVAPKLAELVIADAEWSLKNGRDILKNPSPAPEQVRRLLPHGEALARRLDVEVQGRGRIAVGLTVV